jgi:hypothetical protein
MSNNRELKIILKADGSIAVEELNKVDKELTDLGKGAAKTSKEVEKLDKELGKTGKDAAETAKNIDNAEKEIADLGKSAGGTEKIIERLDKIVNHFGKESNSAAKEIDRLEKEVVDLGRQLGMATGNIDKLEKELRDLSREAEKNSKEVKATTTTWTDFATGVNQALDILEKANRYVKIVWDIAKEGAKVREAKEAFTDYAQSVGKSSDDILGKLSNASGGTIDKLNSIKTASLSMSLGVTKDSDKMANLLSIARNKARLFGIETQQAFEDIVTGIGRASPKILDNLGIRIPASFEKMTEGMSDTEKVAKLFELTLAEGNRQMADMGGVTDSNADSFRQLGASWSNLKNSGGDLISIVFVPLNVVLAKTFDLASGVIDKFNDIYQASIRIKGPYEDISDAELFKTFEGYKRELARKQATLADQQSPANSFRRSEGGIDEGARRQLQLDKALAEQNLRAIETEMKKRSDVLIRTAKDSAESATTAITEVWDKFSNRFDLNESLYEKAKRERLAAEKAAKDAETAGRKKETAEKEAERLAIERQKRLLQAAQIDADSQWEKLAQSVEEAALAPLGKIVKEYELTGKKSIQGLLMGLEIGAASFGNANAPLAGLKLDKLIVDDFKTVETGALQMQKTIELASEKAIENLMGISAAAAGQNTQNSIFAALMKVNNYAENIPDLIARIKDQVVAEQVGEYNKLRYESIPSTGISDFNKDKNQKDKLSKTIAEAVSAGFANADFSNFSLALGSILSEILTKSVAQANPILDTAGNINWGNVGTNLAVSFATRAITGLFTTKEKNKEVIQQASGIEQSISDAYLKTFESELLPFISGTSGGDFFKQQLANARKGVNGLNIGYTYDKGWSWSDMSWVKDYQLNAPGAGDVQANLDYWNKAAEKFNTDQARNVELMEASGLTFDSLVKKADAYTNAAKAAGLVLDTRTLQWTGYGDRAGQNPKYETDLSDEIHDLLVTQLELSRQLGQATAERVSFTSEGFTKYAPWLNSIQIPGSTTVNTGLRINMRDLGLPYDPRPKSYLNYADMSDLSSAQQYDAFSSLQTDFLDRKISTYLLDMVKQAGQSMFDLNSLQVTDLEKYQTEYVSYIDKQMQAFEEVVRRQEEIFLDEAKTYEERTSALELYERNMESYHQAKLDKLRLEKQQQEEENRLIAEQRQAKIEAGLSLVGEMSQRGDRVVILQGGDVDEAGRVYG